MKKQCRRCKWYLPFIDRVKRDGSGDTHVCGETLSSFVDEIGIERFRTYGGVQHCEECGQVLQDNRMIVYQKCAERNKNYKCTAFRAKIRWLPVVMFYRVKDFFK